MPILASSYHFGKGRESKLSHVGWKRPWEVARTNNNINANNGIGKDMFVEETFFSK